MEDHGINSCRIFCVRSQATALKSTDKSCLVKEWLDQSSCLSVASSVCQTKAFFFTVIAGYAIWKVLLISEKIAVESVSIRDVESMDKNWHSSYLLCTGSGFCAAFSSWMRLGECKHSQPYFLGNRKVILMFSLLEKAYVPRCAFIDLCRLFSCYMCC